ncbi:SusD/RagB-like outer membrane lipoprotein [Dyadobacter jejuensis]|uniref:SusD/RagB-like outer membrane lipoprotein n=1 Tax=Dyadobacter jejuensis TaxID=1082580 RepID=A0A316AR71_9BACT|nr:SusD/RagB family nutrient-binding outer membrane lipoprotein [Dyadobacter jejuensis]PWJ60233.1 SusD/RagB-like outer membrane lipoprotein [Dyadobacter jejuensis]
MKNITRRLHWYFTLVLIVGLSGCEGYFDLNENPNLVSNPPLKSLLSTTTQKTALNMQRVGGITSYFVQYLASPSAGSSTDTYQETDYTSTWDALYYAMADLTDMKNLASTEGASEYVGVANVLLSYHISLVADTFGDAPFSGAFTGDPLVPAYDSENSLYQTSLTLIDEGIAELSKTDSKIALSGSDDLIHQGDTEAWIKTAYLLKARLHNKLSKQGTYAPTAVLSAVDKSYTSNDDDARMGTFLLRSPWAQVARDNAALVLNGWLSTQLIDQLLGKNGGVYDPRIEKITDKTVNGEYKGTVNGQGNVGGNNTVKDESYISLNSPLTGDDSPLILASFAELKMIEAEAAFRNNNKTRAYAAYIQGIRANMEKLGVPNEQMEKYLTDPKVAVGEAGISLALIFKEKYVVTYLNPEAWNDARRYNYQYAGFKLPLNAALSTFIRRVGYPSSERAENSNNVPNIITLDSPLWWDQ